MEEQDIYAKVARVRQALRLRDLAANGPGPNAPPRAQLDWLLPRVRERIVARKKSGLHPESVRSSVEAVAGDKTSNLVDWVAVEVLTQPPYDGDCIVIMKKTELLAVVAAYERYVTSTWRGWWRGYTDRRRARKLKKRSYPLPLSLTLYAEYAEFDDVALHVAVLEEILVPVTKKQLPSPEQPSPEHPYR